MADKKAIEFAIKGQDLASKTLNDIGAAVDKLVNNIAEIVPASEKGERNLTELTKAAAELKTALTVIGKENAAIENIAALKQRTKDAAVALAAATEKQTAAAAAKAADTEKTKSLAVALTASNRELKVATLEQNRANAALENARVAAERLGIDLKDLAGSQAKVDAAFAAAAPAAARVNVAIESYAANQKAAKAATDAQTLAEEKAAAEKKANAELDQRLAAATKQVAHANHEAGESAESLIKGFSLFRDEGRTTLSLFQRIRGEVLSMTAEFVGFYGIIEQVKSGFEDLEKIEGAESILTSTFGEKGAGEQLAYVSAQADRLGLSYVSLAKDYAKFTAAAVNNGTSQADAKRVFETFAEAAKVKRLSAEDTSNIFAALEKIYAKDTVGAGELFRKLTVELPEISSAFRKAFALPQGGILDPQQFDALIKSGKLTGEFFTAFAEKYRESFSEQLPAATKTTASELTRFSNEFDKLKIQVLEGGALEAFSDGLRKITEYLKSDDGKKFSQQLADGLKTVAEGFVFVTERLNGLKGALEILAVYWAANVGVGFYKDLKKLGTGFLELANKIPVLNTDLKRFGDNSIGALGKVGAYFGVVAVGIAAFNIGTLLFENSAGVRQFGAFLIGSFDIAFQKIKQIGTDVIAYIFDNDNYEAKAKASATAFAKSYADFKDQLEEAGRDESGKPLADPAKDGAGAAPTAKPKTAEEIKADEARNLAALNEERDKAFKSVVDRVGALQSGLEKKTAETVADFNKGLAESLKPYRDEIADLQKQFSHNSDALVAKLNGQIAAYSAAARQQFINGQNEKSATRQVSDVNELLKERREDVQAIEESRKLGDITELSAQRQIADITNKSNAEAREQINGILTFIRSLPNEVQERLHATTNELTATLKGLRDVKPDLEVTDAKETAKALTDELAKRATLLDAVNARQKAGVIDSAEALRQQQEITKEYDPAIKAALAYVKILRESPSLTEEQRKNLEGTADALERVALGAKVVKTDLLTASQVANDLASGGVRVADAFAKSLGTGHGLAKSFREAGKAFREFAADFLLQIGEMILKQTLLNALGGGGASGASGGTSSSGGLLSGLSSAIAGGVNSLFSSGIAATGAAAAGTDTGLVANAIGLGALHMGGMAGSGIPRQAMASWFENAPRYHTGGVVGLQQNEVPAILQRGEEVLAKQDSRNRANGGGSSPQHIQVVNAVDHESVVRQGLQAPSNTKVILNLIRANRTGVKAALA